MFLFTFLGEAFKYSVYNFGSKEFAFFNNIIWIIFAIDYFIMLGLAENRLRFVRSHPIELLLVLIPHLRPLRALRILFMFERVIGNARRQIYVSVPYYVSGAAVLIVLLAAGAI